MYCYSGRYLQNSKINYGDSLEEAMNKIYKKLSEITGNNLNWMEEFSQNNCCESERLCRECKRNLNLIYCGNPLPIIGVQSGDHYDTIFEKIDEWLQ